jgi:hypothetical protein
LSHVTAGGDVRMVDVGSKPATRRRAVARGRVRMARETAARLTALPKGDALVAAQLAGIMAAKRTAELVPLCHPLPLTDLLLSGIVYGDPPGTAWELGTDPLETTASALLARLNATARRTIQPRLATVDFADAVGIGALNDTGQLRFNGRRELAAINALEGDVLDPSADQSTTAVLDKLSGAGVIGARQRQARTQLLAGVLEQLLVDSKRARDSESATLNMQTQQWLNGQAANEAFVAGTGDALRTWRQR